MRLTSLAADSHVTISSNSGFADRVRLTKMRSRLVLFAGFGFWISSLLVPPLALFAPVDQMTTGALEVRTLVSGVAAEQCQPAGGVVLSVTPVPLAHTCSNSSFTTHVMPALRMPSFLVSAKATLLSDPA